MTATIGHKNHKHEFSGLWWCFGPYKRQDVHVHDCTVHWGTVRADECGRVLIGNGRTCDGYYATHWREWLQ